MKIKVNGIRLGMGSGMIIGSFITALIGDLSNMGIIAAIVFCCTGLLLLGLSFEMKPE